jgi:hypothetical protein
VQSPNEPQSNEPEQLLSVQSQPPTVQFGPSLFQTEQSPPLPPQKNATVNGSLAARAELACIARAIPKNAIATKIPNFIATPFRPFMQPH